MVLLRDSWWIVLLAPAFAFVSTQIAFFSHDAAHHQIPQGGRVSALLALVHGNLLIGMSYGWWAAYDGSEPGRVVRHRPAAPA